MLDNSGHGTGTIGILAGGRVSRQGGIYLGGAPGAEVVPVRVADSVALLRTSALAQGLQHAIDTNCDVVSLCMGGLPSKLWAERVDQAYDHGVTICAAAGNHYGPAPPRVVVYPARFPRVIAVTGVMADGRATGQSAPPIKGVVAEVVGATEAAPAMPNPPYRRLRVYAVDPSFSTRLETSGIDETTLQVRWESTADPKDPAAFGEYFAMHDTDAKDKKYDVVNLNDPPLLAQDGWAPSEGNPQFHQQNGVCGGNVHD